MRAIDHDAQAFEGQAPGNGSFRVFDVAAERIIDANGLADFTGGGTDRFDGAAEDEFFNAALDVVIQFIAIRAEKFNSVIVVRVVRGGDNNAGVRAKAASGISHARG